MIRFASAQINDCNHTTVAGQEENNPSPPETIRSVLHTTDELNVEIHIIVKRDDTARINTQSFTLVYRDALFQSTASNTNANPSPSSFVDKAFATEEAAPKRF